MQRHTIRTILGGLLLAASCASAHAWIGQPHHDWSVTLPLGHVHFGIVEWDTGYSTIYLGLLDFSVPFGARITAAAFGCIGFIAATVATWLLTRRRARL